MAIDDTILPYAYNITGIYHYIEISIIADGVPILNRYY